MGENCYPRWNWYIWDKNHSNVKRIDHFRSSWTDERFYICEWDSVGAPQFIRYSKSKLSILVSKTFNKSLKHSTFSKNLAFQTCARLRNTWNAAKIHLGSAHNVQISTACVRNQYKLYCTVYKVIISCGIFWTKSGLLRCRPLMTSYFFSGSCTGSECIEKIRVKCNGETRVLKMATTVKKNSGTG